jgi:hypothetical protein
MKTFLMVLIPLLLLATVMPAAAQNYMDPGSVPQYFIQPIVSSKAYVNSQADTSSAFTIGGASKLAYNVYYADSAVTKTYLDYRIVGNTAWTLKDSNSVTQTAAGRAEWVIRDGITDKVPGLKIQIRFRKTFSASNNGVTSATYSDELDWKP